MKCRYLPIACAILASVAATSAQTQPVFNSQEKSVADRMGHLRALPDDEWTLEVGRLARQIQALPAGEGKRRLIGSLTGLATEGDAGHETLQTIADTSSRSPACRLVSARPMRCARHPGALRARAGVARRSRVPRGHGEAGSRRRRRLSPQFTLSDLQGGRWSLEALRGKVVLVNFWATWCPPCRKEMPDMQALYQRFGPRGFVVLAISDDDAGKVGAVSWRRGRSPSRCCFDSERTVNQLFAVEGIPKSFLYGRDGKLVAQAIDRRTSRQFLEMLKLAGLE